MIPTYDRVLNAIKKTLQELIEEYQNIGRFFQDLVES